MRYSFIVSTLILIYLLNIGLLGCNHSEKSNEVLIIFKGYPSKETHFIFGSGQTYTDDSPRVSYYDSKKSVFIPVNTEKKMDTVRIKVVADYIVVTHRFNSITKNDYLLRKGDIAVFEYKGDCPSLKILNRTVLKYDVQYDSLIKKRFHREIISPIDKYFEPLFALNISKLPHKDFVKEVSNEVINIKKVNLKLSLDLVTEESIFLDSLLSQKLISEDAFGYYKNRNFFTKQKLYLADKQLQLGGFEKILTQSNDKIIKDLNYKSFLESGFDTFWLSKTTPRDLKDGVNKDYKEAYQMIKGISFLGVDDRNYLLAREVNRIANSFSSKDFLAYFSLFEKDVTDTTYVNYIRSNHTLKFNDKRNETNSLVLMSSDKKQLSFDDLKKRHVGKLIYVDFWASWCAPCRKALPASVKIKDKNKEVIFAYLSIDNSPQPWIKAMNAEGLSNYAESYLVINTKTSNFLKKQNVSAIPRYMIFDKKGVLAFANAPSAESKELEATFEKLLK
ncbi:TlpA disulfide reductase family protein [Cellulophaga sp. BC115SP]|uniref:TlpA family protein disulfide reductase n=1 Tax=Cellulophaga sp. BC115SP TaxID=2683263 RepID=UPI001412C75A|nr:TlpA disulfide reductase family protein [Cellulophaga sp. BC115SP]NBB28219.1 redoxin family protein [Cellulophaga sp. BC115SP]